MGKPLPFQSTLKDVKLEKFNQDQPGFLRVTVDKNKIQFEYFQVPFVGGPSQVTLFDQFTA